MKYEVVREFPNDIIFEESEIYVSIYQPTHRHRPENKQDIIRFKQLLETVELALAEKITKKEMEKFLEPLYELQKDKMFWEHTKDGLVILLNENRCVIYKLNRSVKEIAVVSDTFHIKPLIRVFQSADAYYVLGINMQKYNLYIGNRYDLEEVVFDEDTPRNVEEVLKELGDAYETGYLTHGTYGGTAGGNSVYHGQGGKKEEVLKYTEKFFKYVDRMVIENYTNPTNFPLILAGLDENQSQFRKLSHNKNLLEKGIKIDYESIDKDDLTEKSWEIMEEFYRNKSKELIDKFNNLLGTGNSSDNLVEIAKSAVSGRVDKLLIKSDVIIPGIVDKLTGEIELIEDSNAPNDVLNSILEIVLKEAGEVVLLSEEDMPTKEPIAAIFRF